MEIGKPNNQNQKGTLPSSPPDDKPINVPPAKPLEPPENPSSSSPSTPAQPVAPPPPPPQTSPPEPVKSATPPPVTPTPPAAPIPSTPTPPTPPAPTPEPVKPPIVSPNTPTPTEPPKPATPKDSFPFKPLDQEQPLKTEPSIGVQLEDEGSDEKIEVSDYSQPKKDVNPSIPPPPKPELNHPVTPPIKHGPSGAKPVITILVLAIGFMTLGFAGGYLGFRYSPKLAKLFSVTADTSQNSEQTTSDTTTKPQTASDKPGEVTAWPVYSNILDQYSIKYPDNWYSQNTNDPSAKSVTFTSFNPTDTAATGFKVEISSQSLNGKSLKDWIEANNTVTKDTGGSLSTLTISGQEAYQQTTTGAVKSVKTYLQRNGNVITVSYTGPEAKFDEGKALYTKMIESIKLL